MIFNRKRTLVFIVLAVALGAAVGRWQGGHHAERMRARLELRWPNLMALPEPTRALLVKAALACDLVDQSAPTPGSVEACVREGAAEAGLRMPQVQEAGP